MISSEIKKRLILKAVWVQTFGNHPLKLLSKAFYQLTKSYIIMDLVSQ